MTPTGGGGGGAREGLSEKASFSSPDVQKVHYVSDSALGTGDHQGY